MIVPRSVNNEIFIGYYFKLRIQVLQLVTDVVSLQGGGLEWCIGQKSEKIPLHCFQCFMKISIKFFHWRVIVNITVELKWTQLLLIADYPLQQNFLCQG